ncbi:hypothetical protein OIV83_004208 [Microbotryomycetes sp. JL201]|nr:hypothetical protein OIV83_004208 [Microbotryomycetes sp. JL201]
MHSHSVVHSKVSFLPSRATRHELATILLSMRFHPSKQNPTFDATAVENALLDTSTLLFSIQSILQSALHKAFDKTAQAFPLCFNAAFIQRLNQDLEHQERVAESLLRIANRTENESPRGKEFRRLLDHLSRLVSPEASADPLESVKRALLLMARDHGRKDAMHNSDNTRRRVRGADENSSLELELDPEASTLTQSGSGVDEGMDSMLGVEDFDV